MSNPATHLHDRSCSRLLPAGLIVVIALVCGPWSIGVQPTATALMTDRNYLPASGEFALPNVFRLDDSGNVFFTSGGSTALFKWSPGAGRTRLLQANDMHPAVSGEALTGSIMDVVGLNLQVNAQGHAAMINQIAMPGVREPSGIVLYDGSSYRLIAGRGEDIPGGGGSFAGFGTLFLNDNDQVAFIGGAEPTGFGPSGIFLGSPSGTVKKIAMMQDPAPAGLGGTISSLFPFGLNNDGWVAFYAGISDGTVPSAVLVSNGTEVKVIVKSGDAAVGTAGTFNLPASTSSYFLNVDGDVAFTSPVTGVTGGNAGIWIGNGTDPIEKLAVQGEPTGIAGWGSHTASFVLRGFNDSGIALFQSNITSPAVPSFALFLKGLAHPTEFVFYRGQSVPGGSANTFTSANQAALGSSGSVAFLALLTNSGYGWYLGTGETVPGSSTAVPIAVQGETTPIDGVYGLVGRQTAASINADDQVLFLTDVPGADAVALFRYDGESGVVPVVSTNDPLPAGATTLLRFANAACDTDALISVFKAGGKRTFYSKPLVSGKGAVRRVVAEFDPGPDWGVFSSILSLSISPLGVVFNASLLGGAPNPYPAAGIFASLPRTDLVRVNATGESVPGGAEGEIFGPSFGAPQLSRDKPQVAFWASTSKGSGIFLATQDEFTETVAHSGDPWPTSATATISGFPSTVSLNTNGQVAFLANRSGSGMGLFVGAADADPVKVVETGDVTDIGTITNIMTPFEINDAGHVAYGAQHLAPPDTPASAVFLDSQVIAKTGDSAPGSGGGVFAGLNLSSIDLNSSGQVAFWASLSGSGVMNGWYLGSGGSAPKARLLHGFNLPGGGKAGPLPGGNRLAVLADSGEMAFYVPNIEDADNLTRLVLADKNGNLRTFANTGEKANGTGADFGRIYGTMTVTPSGRFLFGALLVGGQAKSGVFIDKGK